MMTVGGSGSVPTAGVANLSDFVRLFPNSKQANEARITSESFISQTRKMKKSPE